MKIDQVTGTHGDFHDFGGFFQQMNIIFHGFPDMRPLDFDHNSSAVCKHR